MFFKKLAFSPIYQVDLARSQKQGGKKPRGRLQQYRWWTNVGKSIILCQCHVDRLATESICWHRSIALLAVKQDSNVYNRGFLGLSRSRGYVALLRGLICRSQFLNNFLKIFIRNVLIFPQKCSQNVPQLFEAFWPAQAQHQVYFTGLYPP